MTDRSLEHVRRFARLMDSAFRVPGTRFRVGLDPIIGLVPWIGDAVAPIFGLVLITHAMRLRVPRVIMLRMAINLAVDAIVGEIPVLGDLFDFAWKANEWNLALLERHARTPVRPSKTDWIVVGLAFASVALAVLVPLLVLIWITSKVGLI